jgi:ABC-type nitrate/sulfonate/bicarbonate transport system substrate-binding protein
MTHSSHYLTAMDVEPPVRAQHRRRFLRQVLGAVGAGAVLPLLGACALSPVLPTVATNAPASDGRTAATTASGLSKVSYAFGNVNPQHWVALIGSERPELPSRYGIAFDLVTTVNAPSAMNALVGGSVDVAVVTPDAAWPAQDKAPDVKQVFAVGNGTPGLLIAQTEIRKATDLKGMILGASALKGGPDTTALRLMLLENGLHEGDYAIVQSGTVADRTAAMRARSIQAIYQLEPQATLLREAGFQVIDSGNNYASLKNIHALILVARQSWYLEHPDVAVNFVRAWDAITKWLYDPANKDEVLAITRKTMEVGDGPARNAYDLHISQRVPAQDLHINDAFMHQFIENLKKVDDGADSLPGDPMKYVDSTLVDRALAA